MKRDYPIIWVIGATRSCKTVLARHIAQHLAQEGRFQLLSTSEMFRETFQEIDTQSRDYVQKLSQFSAGVVAQAPDANLDDLVKRLQGVVGPCVIEGERNPFEFAKLYDPTKDMAIFLHRLDIETYDTPIEPGIGVIEQSVRWAVAAGIAPTSSVCEISFGLEGIRMTQFGAHKMPDDVLHVMASDPAIVPDQRDRYPWINDVKALVRDYVMAYRGDPAERPQIDHAAAVRAFQQG